MTEIASRREERRRPRAPLPTVHNERHVTPPRADAVSGKAIGVDLAGLAAALRGRVRGEVRFNDGDRALYSTDASNYRQIPVGVVIPRDAEDVVAAVAACREFGAPIVARGRIALDYCREAVAFNEQVALEFSGRGYQRGVAPSLLHLKSPYPYSILS